VGEETGILGLVTYRSTEGGVSRGAVSIQFDFKSQDEIDAVCMACDTSDALIDSGDQYRQSRH
jgi:hypothetical protein